MTGLFIVPHARTDAVPGQMPRLDPEIDISASPNFHIEQIFDESPRPILTVDAVAQNLGLSTGDERFVRSLVARGMTASNELTFRQEVMSSLMERGYDASLRRAVLARALNYYRFAKGDARTSDSPAAGRPELEALRRPRRRMVVRPQTQKTQDVAKGGEGPGAHLRSALRRLFEEAGDLGIPTKSLVDFVQKHGSKAVADTLRTLGVKVHHDRVFVEKSLRFIAKAATEQLPVSPGVGTAGDDPRSSPPGTRKVWNKRIVEKQADGKWHVVGHVDGLEDPKKVPDLDAGMLDKEHLIHLLQQLLRIHHAINGKPDGRQAKRQGTKFTHSRRD